MFDRGGQNKDNLEKMAIKEKAKRAGLTEDQVEVSSHDTITLYRGLGLPKAAIKVYRERQKSQRGLRFVGFTSTSLNMEVALQFACDAEKNTPENNLEPVLLKIEAKQNVGRHKNLLNDDKLSAFPEEEECLLAGIKLQVQEVREEEMEYDGAKWMVTVITLEEPS